MIEVEFLVGRAVTKSFDVHQVAVHVRVVQSAERHVCRGKRKRKRKKKEEEEEGGGRRRVSSSRLDLM